MEVDETSTQPDGATVSPIEKTHQTERHESPPVSPTDTRRIPSLHSRADPDAQATVTDYLDFTEYLPSDMMRSLTLIGKLDETYATASTTLHQLTKTWGSLPSLPADQRPVPTKLRADISENVQRAVSSRVFSHAEACRMRDNVNRHYNRAKTILAKLQTMKENYPTDVETKSPVQTRSPQAVRAPKITFRVDSNGQKIRRPPRITVPGEVLAPYEIDMNTYSDSGDDSSDDDMNMSPGRKSTPGPRIKLVKTPKVPKLKVPKPPRPPRTPLAPGQVAPMSTSSALAALEPPPENAVVGGEYAPWLQLTPYELAKLRKRMKKNAVWNPSDTMIARELKLLGRGVEAYKAAQKHAEENGLPFEDAVPAMVVDAESGAQHPPVGAISAETLTADEVQLSNRGMKLNEAKKLKREALAKMAAEEAEESARKMSEAARMFLVPEGSPSVASTTTAAPTNANANDKALAAKKRKRDSASEALTVEKVETLESQQARPVIKRTKTETPIPPPQLATRPPSVPPATQTPIPVPQFGKPPVVVPPAKSSDTLGGTPKPTGSVRSVTSPVPPPSFTTTIPTKPAADVAVPPAVKASTTPILPPVRDIPKRETRNNNLQPTPNNKQPVSRQVTPVPAPTTSIITAAPSATIPAPAAIETPAATTGNRRPTSRGKASSQEPQPALADRPRRTSTARNTPAPEVRQPSKRTKRPAPGVVTTNSGGTSAVGKRKAAPRKKSRGSAARRSNQGVASSGTSAADAEVEVEVDDDGNIVDPDEPRYCLCNRVSFGTMIQCDNIDVSETLNSTKKLTPAAAAVAEALRAKLNNPSKAKKYSDTFSTSGIDNGGSSSSSSERKSERLQVQNLQKQKLIADEEPASLPVSLPHVQNCKQEWFHLECVDLTAIPARTTKWYCPDCRVALNIGGKGEVTSRGVKT